jgi:hypothetical protein
MKKLHRSYRRLKNETAHGFKPNGTCGRRMWVIHTLGVSSTLIHIATRFGTSQDITQRSTAQRNKKGRPAEAGLPARIFGAESLHNNIVVTVSLSNARST